MLLSQQIHVHGMLIYMYLKVFGCVFDSFIAVKVLRLCDLRLERADVEQYTTTLVG